MLQACQYEQALVRPRLGYLASRVGYPAPGAAKVRPVADVRGEQKAHPDNSDV
jgi:hypothetical protein